jgi:hypothetical protein
MDILNWMKHVPDSKLYRDMAIPGTHNTMTAGIEKASDSGELLQKGAICQFWDLKTQLELGIRYLDIRLNENGGCFHGSFYCGSSIRDVVDITTQFVTSNPSEMIYMSISLENPNIGKEGDIGKYIESVRQSGLFDHPKVMVAHESNPYGEKSPQGGWRAYTLGEIRGKVWVLDGKGCVYKNKAGANVKLSPIEMFQRENHYDWDKSSLWEPYGNWTMFAADRIILGKVDYIRQFNSRAQMDKAGHCWMNNWNVAYLIPWTFPDYFAKGINGKMDEQRYYPRGIQVMDFPHQSIINDIINSNC